MLNIIYIKIVFKSVRDTYLLETHVELAILRIFAVNSLWWFRS